MGLRRRLTDLPKNFAVRIYLYLAVPLIALTAILTVAIVGVQTRMATEHIVANGGTLTHLLAGSLRVGVFSGNRQLIDAALGDALQQRDVDAVTVFDAGGGLLAQGGAHRPGAVPVGDAQGLSADELAALRRTAGVLRREEPDSFEFSAPVVAQASQTSEESLYFPDAGSPSKPNTIGFVSVSLSKASLRSGRAAILTRTLSIIGAFLALGGLAALLVVREATRPLARLLGELRGRGAPLDSEDEDELGGLSDTFGHLVRSLDDALVQIADLNTALEEKVHERTAELQQANAQLQEARDALEERVRQRTAELELTHRQLLHAEKLSAVGRLAASIAHEFNNPIFGIRNVLQSLKRTTALSSENLELVDLAVAECSRVAALIRDLQSFNRPSSGRLAPVDLNRVLEAVLLLSRKELSVKRATLERTFDPGLAAVWGVADQLKQVFLNLLTNALDALPPDGGTIRVFTEARPGEAEIRIQDTGAGIPEENLGRIFEPFFTTKPEVKGTGLGLAVSQGIVESHGGTIGVASRLGEGTIFTIRLPLEGKHP